MPPRSCKVAVIGAGLAGLSTARELLREHHQVVLFEKSNRIGGTWVYTPETDSDPLSLDPSRRVVHSSLYTSLRTNLPRALMGFTDYPFTENFGDPRTFPKHEEVLAFLEKFARDSGVLEVVRFGREVVKVRVGGRKDEWFVETRRESGEVDVDVFQAVVVCNGHNTEPNIPDIPGISKWPGRQIHSHNYRTPAPFEAQIVVMIGNGPSAYDISREVSKTSKKVHLASRSPIIKAGKLDGHDNILQHSMIKCVHADGRVDFNDGSSVLADVIFYCTGYKYHFPFLEARETISIDENHVCGLYRHVFPPHLSPSLSFIGLINLGNIFLAVELQAKWVARVLSEKVALPAEADMVASVNEFYLQLIEMGRPKHHAHTLYPYEAEYYKALAAEAGLPLLEEGRMQMFRLVLKYISTQFDGYRDRWDADFSIQKSQL